MKYIKLLMMIVSAAVFTTACSDDVEIFRINTTDAVVEFNKESVSLKESVNYVNLPIEIKGSNRDGFIRIKAALKSNPSDFDMDKDVVVTSYNFIVPADKQFTNLEVGLHVLTLDMDRGRNISFEITSVEGATLGSNTTCTINIVERNAAEGIFIIKGINPFDGEAQQGLWNFTAEDESFDKIFMDIGLGEKAHVQFTEIIADSRYSIVIDAFQPMGKYTQDGKTYDVFLTCGKYDEDKKSFVLEKETPLRGSFHRTVSDDKETVTITMSDAFGLGYYDEDDVFRWFYYDCFRTGAVMTKNQ